jgi:tRNA(Ile)-lysidine synthase TilS/MesJ
MVANYKDTVRFHEETVAFRKATDWLKKEKSVKYYVTEAAIGMNEGQMDMVRAFRRRVTKQEVRALVEKYPETEQFFQEKTNTTSEHESPHATQTLNEPMSTHFYGKKPDPWQELAETRKELLEKQKEEIEALKEHVRQLEMEKKVLTSTIDGILSTKK